MSKKPKVIAIVGPTASGKTSLSIAIAKQFSGEIISADSRQVYQGMNLGTGKVTKEEMAGVPHHLLDIAKPMDVYTGSDFVKDATVALEEIKMRNHLPIVAGGTFFYLDLLRGKMQSVPVAPNETFRASIADLSTATLLEMLYKKDPQRAATIDSANRRRVIRALEIIDALGAVPLYTPTESPYEWLILGTEITPEALHHNIKARLQERINAGMIEEVAQLHEDGVSYERLDDLGLEYRYIAKYLQGTLTKDEMLEQLETKSRQFAKRQLTWLKRDNEIEWFPPKSHEMIFRFVESFLTE
ncbi:tRNA (adenosine(37)-N6)-dimethylallyltransferase MiaA [Candidatus Parcubacteria bacterium]|nr:tRNA (adenosine(37)-N6)-dimethylallyltransferase MiaA [Candidatus Parcubacteria bacterium]